MSTSTTDRRQGLTSDKGMKAPVKVATNANITLSGLQTIDGVSVVANDYVLVKDQTDATENGIWVANSSDWTRRSDADDARDLACGTTVYVTSGTRAGTYWRITTADPITPGTTSMSWDTGLELTVDGVFDISTAYISPHVGLNSDSGVPPTNIFLVAGGDADDADGLGAIVQFQRYCGGDTGLSNSKALKVSYIQQGSISTADNQWAISGDCTMINPGTGNMVSVSGVTTRNVAGDGVAFGGHFQTKDSIAYASATDVQNAVGAEMNIACKGLDHPTANGNMGRRIVLHLIAHGVNPYGVSGQNAEIGRGLSIETEGEASGAYFRTAIEISESSANTNTIGTGIKIQTSGTYGINMSGAKTTADILLQGNSAVGIILNGTYTTAALRIKTGQYLSLNTSGTQKVLSGAGSPEGVVTAALGSLYCRSDGGAGTTLYVKETGGGNTGWVGK